MDDFYMLVFVLILVFLGKISLENVFKNFDEKINEFRGRIEKLENPEKPEEGGGQ